MNRTLDRHAAPAKPRPALPPAGPTLPPAGPAWYGSVLGTRILAALLQLNSGALPRGSDVALTALLVGLSTAYARRVIADPALLRTGWAEPTTRAQWGMVSMGILAVGSATLTVLPLEQSFEASLLLI